MAPALARTPQLLTRYHPTHQTTCNVTTQLLLFLSSSIRTKPRLFILLIIN